MSFLNLMDPLILHRSPTLRKGNPRWFVTSSTIKSSSPDNHIFGR
eukprot:CAMPEP_0194057186 /NCGR_PEP_ID=MMETSP0009_2-20130614/62603_1 /TAXON_ID=210454 /ORGANISM="Grammatophora oceanica, Strain CCMP 410" /LENGTH=44 /DNA_ID= /DNA_START= /DNA_END= /DNA_ORIENTATION=